MTASVSFRISSSLPTIVLALSSVTAAVVAVLPSSCSGLAPLVRASLSRSSRPRSGLQPPFLLPGRVFAADEIRSRRRGPQSSALIPRADTWMSTYRAKRSKTAATAAATAASNDAMQRSNDGNGDAEVPPSSLLRRWLDHGDASFHYFSDDEAREIGLALVAWYRANRRKLPWRGDPPPWNGSTSDFASKATATKKQKNGAADGGSNKKQTTMDAFFGKKKKRDPDDADKDQQLPAKRSRPQEGQQSAFEVTAYGVWVSEIMLQQTRVEAVVPYWVRWMTSFPTVRELAEASEEQVNSHWAGLGFYRRARLLHQASKVVVEERDGKIPSTVKELLELPGIGQYTACAIASIAYNVSVPVVDGNVCRYAAREIKEDRR